MQENGVPPRRLVLKGWSKEDVFSWEKRKRKKRRGWGKWPRCDLWGAFCPVGLLSGCRLRRSGVGVRGLGLHDSSCTSLWVDLSTPLNLCLRGQERWTGEWLCPQCVAQDCLCVHLVSLLCLRVTLYYLDFHFCLQVRAFLPFPNPFH